MGRSRSIGEYMGSPGPVRDPIAMLVDEHGLQLDLCDLLEHIADSLPDNASPQLVQVAALAIEEGWPRHTAFEEEALFPVLRRHAHTEAELKGVLAQLSAEHAHDLSADTELLSALAELARGGPPRNPEMLGYMLRGYFEALRRHVRLENAYLVPLARRVLVEADIAALRDWIERWPTIDR